MTIFRLISIILYLTWACSSFFFPMVTQPTDSVRCNYLFLISGEEKICLNQEAISSTLYARNFHTKVFWASFLCLEFGFEPRISRVYTRIWRGFRNLVSQKPATESISLFYKSCAEFRKPQSQQGSQAKIFVLRGENWVWSWLQSLL